MQSLSTHPGGDAERPGSSVPALTLNYGTHLWLIRATQHGAARPTFRDVTECVPRSDAATASAQGWDAGLVWAVPRA